MAFAGLMTEAADAGMGSDDLAGPLKSYQWWLTTFPGLAVLSVVLGFNFLGDGLRDAFDPRLRGA